MACCRTLRTEILKAAVAVDNIETRVAHSKNADKWKDLPKGWDEGSRKQFWDSLTGDSKHKITECIKKMKGKVKDPGAFCGGLASRVGYGTVDYLRRRRESGLG